MSRKKDREPRTTKRNEAPSPLARILGAIFRDKGYDRICKEQAVLDSWGRIVGERMAEVTECERVENGQLYIKVSSASWRQELSYMKDELKKSIIRETGYDVIKDIVFY